MNETQRVWSTTDAPAGKALVYWIEAICEGFLEMKVKGPTPTEFAANLTQHPFGPIDLNFADTTVQEVWRTPQMIARSRKHTFYLLYVREGRLVVHQRGRTADIAPGNCVLVDGDEPYSFLLPENNRCVSIQIPQAWLQTWLPAPEDGVATPFAARSRWGATLAYMVGSLAETPPDRLALPPDVIADQLGALMALAVGHEPAGTTIHRQTMLR